MDINLGQIQLGSLAQLLDRGDGQVTSELVGHFTKRLSMDLVHTVPERASKPVRGGGDCLLPVAAIVTAVSGVNRVRRWLRDSCVFRT